MSRTPVVLSYQTPCESADRHPKERLSHGIKDRIASYSISAAAAGVSARALGENMDRRLHAYSLTAVAAGVGLLTFPVTAQGEVIVTKANIPINSTASLLPPTFIDLNHDGIPDLTLSQGGTASGGSFAEAILENPLHGGGVIVSHGYAAALKHGAGIGPSVQFQESGVDVERSHGKAIDGKPSSQQFFGNWGGDPSNRFIGVKFFIHGVTHYGWVRLKISTGRGIYMSGTVTGYAYETIPNKKLEAGAESNDSADAEVQKNTNRRNSPSLGALALGANGLTLWR